jgi:DNA repair exonuclease SbcCD nuclease subunit
LYFITGDTHRNFEHIEYFCKKFNTSKSDRIIVLGDAGLNYFRNNSDVNLKKKVSALPISFFFIRGNHEMRPQDIWRYELSDYAGSLAYIDKEFPDSAFAVDGQVYKIDNKKVLTIGGAYSIDKQYRLSRGFEWFENEQLSEDEMADILNKYRGSKVDCILSHTAPDSEIPYHLLPSSLGKTPNIDNTMEMWLDKIKENVEYKKWYCGHFHISYGDDRFRFMYNDILEFN